MRLFVILALAIALLTVIFALQNTEIVSIDILIWETRSHLALVLLATLALGIIIGLMVSVPAIVRGGWRLSRHQKQLEDLGWRFHQKEEEMSAQRRQAERLQQAHQELLTALDVIHPQTRTLLSQHLPQGVAYRLSQLPPADHASNALSLDSVVLFLLDYHLANGSEFALDQQRVQELHQAIAQRLCPQLAPEIWLYSSEPGQFACLVPDLSVKAASEFGDSLRSRLLENPITFPDGAAVAIELSIGGVVAETQNHLDHEQIIGQAKEALDHAKRRGRNRVRLVQATSA